MGDSFSLHSKKTTDRRFFVGARLAAGVGGHRHRQPRLRRRVSARDNWSIASMDRLDRLYSLLSHPSPHRLPALGEASGDRFGLTAPGAVAVAADAAALGGLVDRGGARYSRGPAAGDGGDAGGRGPHFPRPPPLLVAVGAVAVSVLSGTERGFSCPVAADDHRRHCRWRSAPPTYPRLLRRLHDRNPGGSLRNRGGVRGPAFSDRLDRFWLFFCRRHVPESLAAHSLYLDVDLRSDLRKRVACSRYHCLGSSRGQCVGGSSRPRSLRVAVLYAGDHDPDRDRN